MLEQLDAVRQALVGANSEHRTASQYNNNHFKKVNALPEVKGHLEMKDVCFAYPARRDAPVLEHMSFKIAPGEVVALAGASGCGKSTVSALLTRMYEPDRSRPLPFRVCCPRLFAPPTCCM